MRCVLYRSPVSDFLLKSDGQALAECLPWTGAVPDDQPDDILEMAVRQLDEYFSGARGLFSVPLAYGDVSPFAKDVYDSLRTVAAGCSVTYGQLAAMSGHEQAARAVGGAMNRKDPVDLPETALLREDHLRRFTQPVLPIEVNTAVDQRLCVRERSPRRSMWSRRWRILKERSTPRRSASTRRGSPC